MLTAIGSVIFLITAYALIHYVEGVPRYISVIFSFLVLVAIALAILVVAGLIDLFRTSKAGVRGARLHRRLVGLLSFVAVTPALIAFVLTGGVLQAFSDEYFVDRVTEANFVARDLANGYVTAEARQLGPEILQLAADLALQGAEWPHPRKCAHWLSALPAWAGGGPWDVRRHLARTAIVGSSRG